jgi:hypothetical protein
MQTLHKIGVTLQMIKSEHWISARSFAVTATMLAASSWPRLYQVFWIRGKIFRGCSS